MSSSLPFFLFFLYPLMWFTNGRFFDSVLFWCWWLIWWNPPFDASGFEVVSRYPVSSSLSCHGHDDDVSIGDALALHHLYRPIAYSSLSSFRIGWSVGPKSPFLIQKFGERVWIGGFRPRRAPGDDFVSKSTLEVRAPQRKNEKTRNGETWTIQEKKRQERRHRLVTFRCVVFELSIIHVCFSALVVRTVDKNIFLYSFELLFHVPTATKAKTFCHKYVRTLDLHPNLLE